MIKLKDYLKEIISVLKENGIRTSVFVDPRIDMIEGAKNCGTDRIELYTEDYATNYTEDKEKAIAPYVEAAKKAIELGFEINAGHDLSLENLEYFANEIPDLAEVSIGHALISGLVLLMLDGDQSSKRNPVHTLVFISRSKKDCTMQEFLYKYP